MSLNTNLTGGYGVSVQYTQTHKFTLQIDFHTQYKTGEKKG